jgi:hypothetical protein
LEILEGVLRAVDEWDGISVAVSEAEDRRAAIDVLRGPGFGFSEAQAVHVIDMRQAQRTVAGVDAVRAEVAMLRARLGEEP